MSLTSSLKDPTSPLAKFVASRLPNVAPIRDDWKLRLTGTTTLRPSDDIRLPWATIGTAIDYRLRYYFAVTEPIDLVAVHGGMWRVGAGGPVIDLDLLDESPQRDFIFYDSEDIDASVSPERRPAALLAAPFVDYLTALTDGMSPVGVRLRSDAESALCRACYVLALYDQLYRAGTEIGSPLYTLPAQGTVDDLLKLASNDAVADMCRLSWAFFDSQPSLLAQEAVLNPTFEGSHLVGGADADLIVDGCLIDIKATVNPLPVKPLDLYQPVSYALIDFGDEYGVTSLGVYLARQTVLLRWPLEKYVWHLSEGQSSVESLRRDLRQVLAESSGRGRTS